MIVSCAPFRVSFAGGGSDVVQFYRRRRGAVLSCAIAKYAFVVVHPYFNAAKYHLKYARTELVDRIEQIEHPLLREALRMMKIEPGVEISNAAIDGLYERARAAGALGGKIAGAGGAGFLLLYCPKPAQARVREALGELQSLDFRLDWGGARIAFAQ